MGQTFAQLLTQTCAGKLAPIHWFRTDWQRGGALTGYSQWLDDDGQSHPVVIKLPVPPIERDWLRRLQDHADVCPRLWAHGDTLGGYDLAWVIMERLPHGPLGHHWQGQEFDLLVQAAGRFYAAAKDIPVQGKARHLDWENVLDRARQNIQKQNLPTVQRWAAALKSAHRKLAEWTSIWHARPVDSWCHGDLHLGNALTRQPPPGGPAVLIDFALTRPGHWIEDAVYCEHLFWARRHRLVGRKLCSMLARQRKTHDLPVDADWPRLASIKRKLIALSTPAMLQLDGDPAHVQACLEVLEGG